MSDIKAKFINEEIRFGKRMINKINYFSSFFASFKQFELKSYRKAILNYDILNQNLSNFQIDRLIDVFEFEVMMAGKLDKNKPLYLSNDFIKNLATLLVNLELKQRKLKNDLKNHYRNISKQHTRNLN